MIPPPPPPRPTGKDLSISKLRRKVDQQKLTIEHLHERLARLQSSKRNKASQIARLNEEKAELLEACKDMRYALERMIDCDWPMENEGEAVALCSLHAKVHIAIAKAEGQEKAPSEQQIGT